MGTLSSGQRDTEAAMATYNQDHSEKTNGLNTKLTKEDFRSAFDLRDPTDLSPNTSTMEFSAIELAKKLYAYL